MGISRVTALLSPTIFCMSNSCRSSCYYKFLATSKQGNKQLLLWDQTQNRDNQISRLESKRLPLIQTPTTAGLFPSPDLTVQPLQHYSAHPECWRCVKLPGKMNASSPATLSLFPSIIFSFFKRVSYIFVNACPYIYSRAWLFSVCGQTLLSLALCDSLPGFCTPAGTAVPIYLSAISRWSLL